jgi:hypothetical protein
VVERAAGAALEARLRAVETLNELGGVRDDQPAGRRRS